MAEVYRVDGQFDRSFFSGSSCAFGVFDGVHKGHQYLLLQAQLTADGGSSIALTFDIDPDELFRSDTLKKLMSNEDRIALLSQSGVDAVCVLPFTRDFAQTTPLQFLHETFGSFAPKHLHVGSNFAFGVHASGHVEDLNSWAQSCGTRIHAHSLLNTKGNKVSATRIRSLLQEGAIEQANELLGHPFTFHERVVKGRSEGRAMGFRTANIQVPANRFVLASGVYAGIVRIHDKCYRAAISVGVAPMFPNTPANCEVHILDFEEDLYGQYIAVEFHTWIRPMIVFESTQDLIDEVMRNIEYTRTHIAL